MRRPIQHLFLFIGADPNTDWLSGSGVALDAKGRLAIPSRNGGNHENRCEPSTDLRRRTGNTTSPPTLFCAVGPGAFMISLAIVSFLAGAVLGLWFWVPVLVLAIMLALIVVIGAGAATEVNPWWIVLEALVVTVCLQLGYILGIIIATYVPAREYRDLQRAGRDAIADLWPP